MGLTYNPNASWRDTARQPRLWIFNCRALPPIVVALFHIKVWTICFAILCTVALQVLEYYGFTVPVFIRYVKSKLAGQRRFATPWWM
ncbi:MAG: IcmT/TraK family protein [Pseudomonadota bacterium]|nr:IcmT/TraK family protein [Pseudomonadota bacterium]